MINVTFSPNGLVVEKRDHTSIGFGKLDMPSVQEYEKIGPAFLKLETLLFQNMFLLFHLIL